MDATRFGSRRAVVGAVLLALALAGCGGGGGTPPAPPPQPAGVTVTTCRALAPLSTGTCQVATGGPGLLLEGDLLLPGQLLRGGRVAVDAAGLIACVGCDCAAAVAGATRVTCPQGVISPGLVNAHDHVTFTQNPPYAATAERYEHRYDWRIGASGHPRIVAAGSATVAELQWGELRQVLAGTTSVVGAGGTAGLLRNLDRPTQREGLTGAATAVDSFPLGDASSLPRTSGCGYPAIITAASLAADPAALLHAAEGIDARAANELTCLTSALGGGQDLALPQVAFVSAIAARPQDLALLASRGTGLVWSPRSNVALYGDTARVTEAARLGVQIALGTDWGVTGSSTLGRELACADQWNRERLAGFFTDEQLWLQATRNGADLAGVLDQVGLLAAGRQADLAIFDGAVHRDFRAVLDAGPADVALVLRGGRVLAGDAAVVEALAGAGCDAVDACGVAKRACLQAELGTSFAALAAANLASPAPLACGVPIGEPTCTPARTEPAAAVNGSTRYDGARGAGDQDGDGIPDALDQCPAVFDPIRPMDNGQQADADGDQVGDACDPCPLAAGTLVCPAVDPNDLDADEVTTVQDNCPTTWNPDQADADSDGKGDACDACPQAANPGSAGCPQPIMALKDGTVPLGVVVAVNGALVTGRTTAGFFLQAKPGDAGYAGPDFSGIWVQAPQHAVAVGDRVTILSATLTDFFGQRQLAGPAVVVDQHLGEAPPAPVVVTPAEVATGGARAAALEAVLVEVQGVVVTDANPPPSAGDPAPIHEFVVGGALRVDDLLYLVTPFPAVDQAYLTIAGVLVLRHGDTKLEPRNAADLVPGP